MQFIVQAEILLKVDRDISGHDTWTVKTTRLMGRGESPGSDYKVRGRAGSPGSIGCFHVFCVFLPGVVLPDPNLKWTLFQFPLRIQL